MEACSTVCGIRYYDALREAKTLQGKQARAEAVAAVEANGLPAR